jgi:hypothetical protein
MLDRRWTQREIVLGNRVVSAEMARFRMQDCDQRIVRMRKNPLIEDMNVLNCREGAGNKKHDS